MKAKKTFLKRALSSFMALVIVFTAVSYDAYAADISGGESYEYEYEYGEDSAIEDVSENETSVDISDNETVEIISEDEAIVDVSENETVDVTPKDDASSNNAEDESQPDVSADDALPEESEPSESIVPEWFKGGYVHNPNEVPADKITLKRGELRNTPLEARYYPTDLALSLRDQNPYGTCWAFSSIALAELFMFRQHQKTPDYSELHLAYFCYRPVNDPLGGLDGDIADSSWDYLEDGGNNQEAGFTFATWRGVASESNVPYSSASTVRSKGISAELAYDDEIHLRNFYEINIQENPEIVKKFVKENGGVALSFRVEDGTSAYASSEVYNSEYNCYYNAEALSSNHGVTIVGWDDNFSKSNFAQTPEKDGAWLIRNSWTTGNFADNQNFSGYFWLSYCDKTISRNVYAFIFDDIEEYDNNYQYDGIPSNMTLTSSTNTITAANVFTAKACAAGEVLKAVSFHTSSANFTAEIKIYKPDNANKPNSGVLLTSQTYSSAYPGYHTVDLADAIALDPNEKFSVIVKITSSNDNATFSCEGGGYKGYTSHADEGESFVTYDDGRTWTDFGTQHECNLRIKAFTCNMLENVEITGITFKENITSTGITFGVGDEYAVKTTTTPQQVSNSKLTWTSNDESVATVSSSGCITGVGVGTAVITATAPSGVSCSVTVTVIDIPEIYISFEEDSGAVTTDSFERGTSRQYRVYSANDGEDITDRVSFSVSNTDLISVDTTGLVTALKAGEVILYAKYLTKTASVTISVKTIIAKVKPTVLRDSTVILTWDATGAFEYEVRFMDDSNRSSVVIEGVPGQESFSYVDTYYKDITEKKEPYYTVIAKEYVGSGTSAWSGRGAGVWAVVGPVFDINYYLNGGTNHPDNPDFIRAGAGTVYLKSPEPPVGYWFAGWYTSATYELRISSLSQAKEYNLYAKYEPIQYYVKLDGNGATSGVSRIFTLTYDKDWEVPENNKYSRFKRAGWAFTGWNTEPDGSGTDYTPGDKIKNLTTESSATILFYAQWETPKYDVTFDANGGTSVDTVKRLGYNEPYGTLPETAREGYDFTGWYTEASGGSEITETSLFTGEANQVLYAHWTPKSYTLSFEDPEGHNEIEDRSVTYTAEYGTLPEPTRTGYNFAGWYLGENKILATTIVETIGNHTLTAHWTAKSVKVTFNANGGTVSPAYLTVEYDGRYDKNGDLPEPVKPKFDFTGWYTEADGGDLVDGSTIVDKETDHTLYAHWKGAVREVSFDLRCEESELRPSSPEINKIKVEYGKTFGDALNLDGTPAGGLKTPERVGYNFLGWYTSTEFKTKITDETLVDITTNITLYAQWEETLVNVTFMPDNGDIAVTEALVFGGYYELPETPVMRGYSFAGWYTNPYIPENPDDKGELKTESVKLTNPDDHALYGHWTPNVYTIRFVDTDDTLIKSLTATFDAAIAGEIPAPEKTGYVFTGWSLDDAAIDIDALKLQYDYDSDITLKACYVPRTDIQVTFDPAEGTLAETVWTVTYMTPYETESRTFLFRKKNTMSSPAGLQDPKAT